MTEFDAVLKRSFAEFHEPEDDGFALRVGQAVARREAGARAYGALMSGGMALAGTAVLYGVYVAASTVGQEFLADAGLGFARAYGALAGAPDVSVQAQSWVQSVGAGLTQVLLIAAALAGGAVAYRAAQD